MMRMRALLPLFLVGLLMIAGCEQTSIAEQERVSNLATLEASTPSATATATATPTATSTPTATPTVGPTFTPTITPLPSPTPLPPSPTPNPALANFSLCNQTAGDQGGGLFSAQLNAVTVTTGTMFDRITIGLTVPGDSAPPHATARCIAASDQPQPYELRLELDAWLHDQLFASSELTRTIPLSGTGALKSLAFETNPAASIGTTLVAGLSEPAPFRLTYEPAPPRLVLDVAHSAQLGPQSDPLTVASAASATPPDPVYYLQGGDIWSIASGKATNLTQSDSRQFGGVTSLAVSTAADKAAFCATAPGADADDVLSPGALWLMDLDGANQVQLAAEGLACTDPVFSPDGKAIAFTVNDGDAVPPRFGIYTVPTAGGDAKRLTASRDEWSRYAPQWLDAGRIVYAASAEDGRNTLFIHDASGREEDIGGQLVVGDRYRALGRPLAAPDGSAIAVEALRATAPGADLVLLDKNGVETDTISGSYWVRPVAWGADKTLFYLTATCAAEVVQPYTLVARTLAGSEQILAAGTATGAFGAFSASGAGLAYVTLEQAAPGPRGPAVIDRASPSVLWYWDIAKGPRSQLAKADTAISAIAP